MKVRTMIGINFFVFKDQNIIAERGGNDDAFSADVHDFIKTIRDKYPALSLQFFRPYINYPMFARKAANAVLIMEGYVHGFTHQEAFDKLEQLVVHQQCQPEDIQNLLKTWSGDYLLMILSEHSCWMFNDYFGRLSVYWHHSEQAFFAGRSLPLYFNYFPRKANVLAVAQAAWCGYPIASNTLYEKLYKLKANSAFVYDFELNDARMLSAELLNFDEQHVQDEKTAAKELAGLYLEACRKIARSVYPLPVNVSLSGGQDSRMVAWGFKQSGASVYASTFRNSHSINDVDIAKKIATLCEIPLRVYDIVDKPGDEEKLLQWKQGMNYVGMSFIIDFYEQLQQQFTNGSLYVTGDAADVTLRYLGEPGSRFSMDALVEKQIRRYMILPLEDVEGITGVKPDTIKQSIYEVLHSYPEQDPNNKAYHYYIFQRFSQNYFEGEDRSRCYFWATNPFFDIPFFHRGRVVPQTHKKAYKFFRHFMHALSYPLSEINDANGYSINNWQYRTKRQVQEVFRSTHPAVKSFLHALYTRNLARDYSRIQMLQQDLPALIENNDNLAWMNADGLYKALAKADEKQTEFLRNILKALTLTPRLTTA